MKTFQRFVANRSTCILMLSLAIPLCVGAAKAQSTARASVSTAGVQGNDDSPGAGAKISANGQAVAFRSVATNLVANDKNRKADIFVREGGITTRVSVTSGGLEAVGGDSNNPSISADGRYVSFSSTATNLVPGDTNGTSDVFVRDRVLGTTRIVSVNSAGGQGNGLSDSSAISADGNMIAFRSLATNLDGSTTGSQVFVRNMATGTTTLVSIADNGVDFGNGESGLVQVTMSADGNVVGFSSIAANLVASDANGTVRDVFVRNLLTETTTLISQSTAGQQGMNISYCSALSADGRYVAFASRNALVTGDTNNLVDVFVRDTLLNTTLLVSLNSSGNQGNGASGYTEGWGVSISANGNRVAFQSLASNLVSGDTNGVEDIFLRDISAGITTRISVSSTGQPANNTSGGLSTGSVSMSADGMTVMFASYATNLVSGDTNKAMDVFVRGPIP